MGDISPGICRAIHLHLESLIECERARNRDYEVMRKKKMHPEKVHRSNHSFKSSTYE